MSSWKMASKLLKAKLAVLRLTSNAENAKTIECVKKKCEHPLRAVAQGCKICNNDKACQKKRCPNGTSGLRAEPSDSKPGDMCSWCRQRQHRRMWVCGCLSCANLDWHCPHFCSHRYYQQRFSCAYRSADDYFRRFPSLGNIIAKRRSGNLKH